jgi:hypothetical protein
LNESQSKKMLRSNKQDFREWSSQIIKLERQIGALRLTQERDVGKHDEESNNKTDRRLDSNEWKDTHP